MAAILARWNARAAEKLEGWRWWRVLSAPRSHKFLMPPGEGGGLRASIWEPANGDEPDGGSPMFELPDYAHDLNAVASLEAILAKRGVIDAYLDALYLVVYGESLTAWDGHPSFAITANAAQRLEAVLRACGLIADETVNAL